MKKLLILLVICLCTACTPYIEENSRTLVVVACTDAHIKDGFVTYKICSYDSDGVRHGVYMLYRAKIGTFEVGDTIKLTKYVE